MKNNGDTPVITAWTSPVPPRRRCRASHRGPVPPGAAVRSPAHGRQSRRRPTGVAGKAPSHRTATRTRPGKASFSNSSCFWFISGVISDSPVMLPPGRSHMPPLDGFRCDAIDNGNSAGGVLAAPVATPGSRDKNVHVECHQLGGMVRRPLRLALVPADLLGDRLSLDIAEVVQPLPQASTARPGGVPGARMPRHGSSPTALCGIGSERGREHTQDKSDNHPNDVHPMVVSSRQPHQALRPCLDGDLQVSSILLCRHVVDPTGSGLFQVLPASPSQADLSWPKCMGLYCLRGRSNSASATSLCAAVPAPAGGAVTPRLQDTLSTLRPAPCAKAIVGRRTSVCQAQRRSGVRTG